jgi:hypothetical protein
MLIKLEFSQHNFEKSSNIRFHENLSSGSPVFHAEGRTDGQTEMMKLTVAFRNFATSLKIIHSANVAHL